MVVSFTKPLIVVLAFVVAVPCVAADLVSHVDPFIGTGGHGHTFPGPTVPFGMVQLSPDTRLEGWDGCSGYHYSDEVTNDIPSGAPMVPLLAQNLPNPFSRSTEIRFELPAQVGSSPVPIRLEVFDVTGRLVQTLSTDHVSPGLQAVIWSGVDHRGNPVPSGSYWYRLITPMGTATKRLILLR